VPVERCWRLEWVDERLFPLLLFERANAAEAPLNARASARAQESSDFMEDWCAAARKTRRLS
jgi:hypothetical protein